VLAEIHRVVHPGGELRFYEHVISQNPRLATCQHMADRLFWPILSGGCHTSRDTLATIERTGFRIASCRRFTFKPSPLIACSAPHVVGVAHRV
jgi:hypothetical protein